MHEITTIRADVLDECFSTKSVFAGINLSLVKHDYIKQNKDLHTNSMHQPRIRAKRTFSSVNSSGGHNALNAPTANSALVFFPPGTLYWRS